MFRVLAAVSVLVGYASAQCENFLTTTTSIRTPIGICWDVSATGATDTVYSSQKWACNDDDDTNITATLWTYPTAACDGDAGVSSTVMQCDGDDDNCWCGGDFEACDYAAYKQFVDCDAAPYTGGIQAVGCFPWAGDGGDYSNDYTTCSTSSPAFTSDRWLGIYYTDAACASAVVTPAPTGPAPTWTPTEAFTPSPTVPTAAPTYCVNWGSSTCSTGSSGGDSGAAEILTRFVFVFVAFAVLY